MANFTVNTDLVRGDEIFLYIYSGASAGAGDVLAFATTCSVQIDGETIDASNKMSGAWASNLAGKNSYTVSTDALYTKASDGVSFDDLFALMLERKAVKWEMAKKAEASYAPGDVICKGEAFITSLSLSAGNNEVASSSITLTGSGAIATAQSAVLAD